MANQPPSVEATNTDRQPFTEAIRRGRRVNAVPVILATASTGLYLISSLLRHAVMGTGFDLTIFTQAMQKYSQFQTPNIFVKSQEPFNILGDHFSPILILLAPFYKLWPSAAVLLVAQSLLFGIAVLILTRFAAARLGNFGLLIGVAYALSWGVLQASSFDFHEIAFAVPILVLALAALEEERWYALAGWCLLLLTTKEDSALLVLGIALALLARRRLTMGAAYLIGSVTAFALIVFVIVPHLSYSGKYTYLEYAGDASVSGGVSGLLDTLFKSVTSWHGVAFLLVLILTAGTGLRSTLVLVLLPTLGARLISTNGAYTSFLFHYNATLVTVCFMALISSLAKAKQSASQAENHSLDSQQSVGGVRSWLEFPRLKITQLTLIVGLTVFSLISSPTMGDIVRGVAPCPKCDQAELVLAKVPSRARVIADVYLMPQIVDRAQVLMAVPSWTDSTNIRLSADWVILDEQSQSYYNAETKWVRSILHSLVTSGEYRQVDSAGPIILLRRSSTQ